MISGVVIFEILNEALYMPTLMPYQIEILNEINELGKVMRKEPWTEEFSWQKEGF